MYLVTGASGYIGMHVVDLLLKQGHQVRASVRNLKHKEKVSALKSLGPVELVEADLNDPDAWHRAVKDVEVIIHLALAVDISMDEDSIIKTAVQGTLNVLRVAKEAKIKRVVISSLSLSAFGFSWQNKTYNEQDWIDLNELKSPYEKSKLMAERAAWNFWEQEIKCFELVSVLPVWVLGPILSATSTTSVVNFSRVFYETVDKVENTACAICDVRDVALAHLRAAQLGEAVVGQRFLVASSNRLLWTSEWAGMLKDAGYKVATVDEATPDLDKCRVENEKMKQVLGVEPIDIHKTLIDMTESLIKFGIIRVES